MSSWGSYPSIFNLGHKAIQNLLSVDVNVEEKIDGSQFSFGLVEASPADIEAEFMPGYALKIRSKGCVMHIDAPEKMFNAAAETVKALGTQLTPSWTYRGEFLARPHHNALTYDRVPKGHIILFDVSTGDQEFLNYEAKVEEANRLGLEVVPRLFTGRVNSIEDFRSFLESVSILGGQKIEGVVIKPVDYNLFGFDKKVLMGKFVSEAFKEVHRKAWGESNPTGKDIFALIGSALNTPARWNKAIQHLREGGRINDDLTDIGPLIREIPEDVLKEEKDYITETLFKWAWPHIKRSLTYGFPQWYKDKLLARAFELEPTAVSSAVVSNELLVGTFELESTSAAISPDPHVPESLQE